mmetsp:Transcript_2402/g.6896  ORF Transcript_2402/g.6896 Transcript_2402/m.6896 type:complete len:176 (+) Transcript_2402:335-862(+)
MTSLSEIFKKFWRSDAIDALSVLPCVASYLRERSRDRAPRALMLALYDVFELDGDNTSDAASIGPNGTSSPSSSVSARGRTCASKIARGLCWASPALERGPPPAVQRRVSRETEFGLRRRGRRLGTSLRGRNQNVVAAPSRGVVIVRRARRAVPNANRRTLRPISFRAGGKLCVF